MKTKDKNVSCFLKAKENKQTIHDKKQMEILLKKVMFHLNWAIPNVEYVFSDEEMVYAVDFCLTNFGLNICESVLDIDIIELLTKAKEYD